MANNCNGACTSSCTNLCDNVCTYVCRNVCTSSCESMCGDSCDTTCISKCSGTSMAITKITTFYDSSYMRKITKLVNNDDDGYLLYPGLNGNMTVFKVSHNFLMGKLATSMYNAKVHGGTEAYHIAPLATEDSEHMQFDERYEVGPRREAEWSFLLHDSDIKDKDKQNAAYSILEIQRVVYDAMMRAVRPDTVNLNFEDILYLIFNDQTVRKLYYDIQNWSWNNTDTFHYNLIKKPTDSEISSNKSANQ